MMDRRKFLAGLGAGFGLAGAARAMPPHLRDVLLIPASVRNAYPLALDFTKQVYWYNGAALQLGGFSSYAGGVNGANAPNLDSLYLPYAVNTPRINNTGMIFEQSRTELVKWNRDLTNVLWVSAAAGITAVKDQVGIDGVSNAASRLTCNTAGGTILQTFTAGSASRLQAAFLRRLSGSGPVSMTEDGVTYTPLSLTNGFQQLQIPAQTLVNPVVGFKMDTAGDVVAVDGVSNNSTNSLFPTTPVFTTSAGLTRTADGLTTNLGSIFADIFCRPSLTIAFEFVRYQVYNGGSFLTVSDGTLNNRYSFNCNGSTADSLSGCTIVSGGTTLGYDPTNNMVDTIGKIYRFAASLNPVTGLVIVGLNGDVRTYPNSLWPNTALFTRIDWGAQANGGVYLGGPLRKCLAKPVASNAQGIFNLCRI